jgi:fatty acid desaturase
MLCLPQNGSAQAWLVGVDPKTATALKDLHRRNPRWNWVCALYPALWLAAAATMERAASWSVRAAGIVVIGVSIQAMAILMHEALHRNLFRNPTWDRWAAFTLGVPAFFSGTAYKVVHLNHHRNTRTAADQDEISNFCRTTAQYRALFYLWYVAGTFVYFFVVPCKAILLATPAVRHRIVREYAAMFAIYAAAITALVTAGHAAWLLSYWLLPAQVAMVLSNVRGMAEHLGTDTGSAITKARTITSNPVVAFLMCNLNYHLEHHLFPGIPWYNLPKAHRLMQSIYARSGVHVQRSYVRHAFEADSFTSPVEMSPQVRVSSLIPTAHRLAVRLRCLKPTPPTLCL